MRVNATTLVAMLLISSCASPGRPPIIGGHPAALGDDPWQVALISAHTPEPRRSFVCGGVLIAPDWVLTAAHCIYDRTGDDVDVLTGTIDTQRGGARIAVVDVIRHGRWNDPGRHHNDIALLQLVRPATAQPIALADASTVDFTTPGQFARVTGWGYTEENGRTQTLLRYAGVPIVSNETCNGPLSYGDDNPATPERITSGMLCAGFEDGGVDACQNDSGGPLSLRVAGVPRLIGVVSWGENCARAHKFGVYTRVAAYQAWIAGCMAGDETTCIRAQRGHVMTDDEAFPQDDDDEGA